MAKLNLLGITGLGAQRSSTLGAETRRAKHVYLITSDDATGLGQFATVYKLSADTGSTVWSVDLDTKVGSAVMAGFEVNHGCADSDSIYFGVRTLVLGILKWHVVSLSQADGSFRWLSSGTTNQRFGTAVFPGDGHIAFGPEKLNSSTGTSIWDAGGGGQYADCDSSSNSYTVDAAPAVESMASYDIDGNLRWATTVPQDPGDTIGAIVGIGANDLDGAWYVGSQGTSPSSLTEKAYLVDSSGTITATRDGSSSSYAALKRYRGVVRNSANNFFTFWQHVSGTDHTRAEVVDGSNNLIVSSWQTDEHNAASPPSRARMWRPLWSASDEFFAPYQFNDSSWALRRLAGTGWDDQTTPVWEFLKTSSTNIFVAITLDFDLPTGGRT